jgi:hypothetical protein
MSGLDVLLQALEKAKLFPFVLALSPLKVLRTFAAAGGTAQRKKRGRRRREAKGFVAAAVLPLATPCVRSQAKGFGAGAKRLERARPAPPSRAFGVRGFDVRARKAEGVMPERHSAPLARPGLWRRGGIAKHSK